MLYLFGITRLFFTLILYLCTLASQLHGWSRSKTSFFVNRKVTCREYIGGTHMTSFLSKFICYVFAEPCDRHPRQQLCCSAKAPFSAHPCRELHAACDASSPALCSGFLSVSLLQATPPTSWLPLGSVRRKCPCLSSPPSPFLDIFL